MEKPKKLLGQPNSMPNCEINRLKKIQSPEKGFRESFCQHSTWWFNFCILLKWLLYSAQILSHWHTEKATYVGMVTLRCTPKTGRLGPQWGEQSDWHWHSSAASCLLSDWTAQESGRRTNCARVFFFLKRSARWKLSVHFQKRNISCRSHLF